MMTYENSDLKNNFFAKSGEELFAKVIYIAYHREGYHQVRLKWYPEAVDNDDELKLVHESLLHHIASNNIDSANQAVNEDNNELAPCCRDLSGCA